MFEEFSTILHTDPYALLVILSVQAGYVQDMASLLHISSPTVSLFIKDRQIDFDPLFAIYTPVGDPNDGIFRSYAIA